MRFIKDSVKCLARTLGYDIVTRSRSPLIEDLTQLRNRLNLSATPLAHTVQYFSNATVDWHLTWLLQQYSINLVLDVGANQGQFVQSVRHFGFGGQIESFEPLSACVSALAPLAASDRGWNVHPYALGANPGEMRLTSFADSSFSSFHQTTAFAKERFGDMLNATGEETVRIETLANLWPMVTACSSNPRVMLKSDTQGHDLDVLRGAGDYLSKVHVIMCELSLVPLYEGTPSYLETFSYLHSRDFECSGLYPVSFRDDRPSIIELNAFFVNVRLSRDSS